MSEIQENGLEALGRFYATYKGIVANNQDPENLGRLQLKVPQVYGDEAYEYWALPKGIFAGNGIGSFWIPAEGDMVWVSFENGDPRFPIWEYGWWKDKDAVPKDATTKVRVLQTSVGHRIVLDDENKKIQIEDCNGNKVELNETGISNVTKKLSLGSLDGSAEPAVLGDTAMDLLNEFIEDLGNIKTIQTSSGVTYAIKTSPEWQVLVNKWSSKWEEFKSKKVTLD